MKRELSHKRNQAKRGQSARVGFLVLLAVLLVCALFFGYRYQHPEFRITDFATSYSNFKTWLTQRKSNLNKDIDTVKKLAKNNDEEVSPIHFEFYTTLPSVQMKANERVEVNNAESDITDRPIQKKPALQTATKNKAITSTSELENELSQEVVQESYVIQLGLFRTAKAAERYLEILANNGYSAKINKLTFADKEIYRVQLGPYRSQSQAKLAERELQKNGLNGIIRKS